MTEESKMLRISVDFNRRSVDGEMVFINTTYHSDLKDQIHTDLKVILYEEQEFEAEAVVTLEIHHGKEFWYGVVDWDTLRYLD